MERMTENSHLDLLRRANARFQRFFQRFAGAGVLGTEEEVAALLQVEESLRSVAVLLDGGLPRERDTLLREELTRYRQNLVFLRQRLAEMQTSAVACRAHLDARRQHLHAVKAWCAASRGTS